MLNFPGKLLRAVSDVTVGTAIVMVHVMLADRERSTRGAHVAAYGVIPPPSGSRRTLE